MDKIKNEQAILGMVLKDSSLMFQYPIDINDFENEEHKIIFTTIKNLIDEKIELEIMTITTYLVEKDLYNKLTDGVEYLTQLIIQTFTTANFKYHYSILKKNRKLRELQQLAESIKNAVSKADANEEKVIEAIHKRVLEINTSSVKNYKDLKQLDEISNEELLNKLNKKVDYTGLNTGYKKLNELIGGFVASQVLVLAARPGIGKTSLALNLATLAAKNNDENIMIFSLEMSNQELYNRILAFESKIEMYKYRYGQFSNQELKQKDEIREKVIKLNIFINDNSIMKIRDIKNDCYRLEREKGKIGLIIIDYLQLIEPGVKAESKYAQITQISRELKQLAKDLNVCVLILSQLNRDVEGRKNKKPQLSDLRDSGAIEQDADIVGLLYVEEVEKSDNVDLIKLDIAKNRHGRTGEIPLYFHKPTNQFYE